jgi:ADP-ribosylglycohydrolase
MLGAIAGDMIGSPYEAAPIKAEDFDLRVSRFTDDTVLTIAVAHSILYEEDCAACFKRYARAYERLPYGGSFRRWVESRDMRPYGSFGNGSAMRVSPVGFACDSIAAVLTQAQATAVVTHNHPEGVKGAQATALAVFLARSGAGKEDIRRDISGRFGYDLDRSVAEIRPDYRFDVSCQGSVPESIIAFLDSVSFEDAVRKAVSLGGDADTMACIAGGIAQAFYKKIPGRIVSGVRAGLPRELLEILDRFNARYRCPL